MKVKFFVDVEADFFYYIPSPHFTKFGMLKWQINKLYGRLYRYPKPTRVGLINLVKVFKSYKLPVSFCIAGHLYFKKCAGWENSTHPLKPRNNWYINKIGKDWYYWDRGGDFHTKPGLYLGDFIEKEMKDVDYFKFGLHGFSHEALTLEDKEVVEDIIKKGVSAAKELGIKIESFGAPFEMLCDLRDPNFILEILKKYKIKESQFAGFDEFLTNLRKLECKKPFKKVGIKLYHISNYLEGTDPFRKFKATLNTIKKLKNKDLTYVIVLHDFTWKREDKLSVFLKGLFKIKGIKFER